MKSLFNIVLLREQFKRYWAIGALSFLVYFLGCLLPLWGANRVDWANETMLTILEMRHPLIIIVNILAPLAMVVAIFSYMYQQNATGVIHSLPFTKKQLFASNVLAGYLLIAVPLFVFCLSLLAVPVAFATENTTNINEFYRSIAVNVFPQGIQYGETINTFPRVCVFFARTLLSFTFYYVLFITAAMVVGNQVIYFLVSLVFPFLTAGLYLLFGLVSFYYVFGYSFESDPLEKILIFTNPVLMPALFTSVQWNNPYTVTAQSLIPCYAAYLLITVVLLAISVWLYHMRKLERAGDTVVFMPLKNFFIFSLSVTGMVSLGVFLLALMRSIVFMYVGFILGFIIALFIAQMIAEKSFNVFYKYKSLLRHGVVALALFAVIQIVCRMDITGYERYIPNDSDIAGVYLGHPYDLKYYEQGSGVLDRIILSDPQTISETVSIHKQIINAKSELRKVFLSNLTSNYREVRDPIITQNITYRLKDGRFVARQYELSESFYNEKGLKNLINSEPVILNDIFWASYPEDIKEIRLDPYYLREMSEDGYPQTYYLNSLEIYEQSEIQSLVEALRKDRVFGGINGITEDEQSTAESFTADSGKFHVYVRTNQSGGMRENYYHTIQYCKNTFEWLETHGYKIVERE